MESKLPKPSGLRRPLTLAKDILPSDRIRAAGNEMMTSSSTSSNHSMLPLTSNLANIREGVISRQARADSPDVMRINSVRVMQRGKLRRSRSACDLREMRQPLKRNEPTVAPLPAKTARFGSNININGSACTTNRPPRIGNVASIPYYKNDAGELGRTIWGLKGLGAAGFVHKTLPKDKLFVTTTRSHNSPIVESALNALSPNQIIKVGGAGYKVLQLLEGNAHAYVYASAGCKKWDTCAPEGVLEAYGGTLTDILGQHYSYGPNVEFPNNSGVLATIDIKHSDIVNKMPDDVLQKFKNVK